jgi:hypothetical protein
MAYSFSTFRSSFARNHRRAREQALARELLAATRANDLGASALRLFLRDVRRSRLACNSRHGAQKLRARDHVKDFDLAFTLSRSQAAWSWLFFALKGWTCCRRTGVAA